MGSAALAFFWQALAVHFNYAGNWSALFCIGSQYERAPQLDAEHPYVFRNSPGYDGAVYHYIAHDPFMQHDLLPYVDAPRYRYRRILIPLAAYTLALGRMDWVDGAYVAVILICVFLGGYWLSRYCALLGMNPMLGCGFLLVPATLISLDRMTVDIALATACAAFAVYVIEGSPWKLYAVLAAAPLVRETGVLLVGGYAGYRLWKREPRKAVLFSTAIIPTLLWYLFVIPQTHPEGGGVFALIPFQGLLTRAFHPTAYALSAPVAVAVTVLDYVSLAGVAMAALLAVRMALHRMMAPLEMATYLFAALAIFLVHPEPWRDPFGYTRALTPLLLLLALSGLMRRSWLAVVPMLLVTLRVIAQLEPQAAGIVRGIF